MICIINLHDYETGIYVRTTLCTKKRSHCLLSCFCYTNHPMTTEEIQQLRQVIREEVKAEIEPLKKDLVSMQIDITTIQKDMVTKSDFEKVIKQLKHTEDVIISHFDRQVGDHEKRIRNIEDELHISRN